MIYIDNKGQGDGAQHQQCGNVIANIKIKIMHYKFFPKLLAFQMFDLENYLGQDRGLQHSQWCHSIASINVYKPLRKLSQFAR